MEVLLLAVVAAVYPTLLAVVVILLRQPNPKRLLLVYFVAGIATSVAIGLAIVFAIEGVVDSSTSPPSVASDLVIGGLLLLSAAVLATHADVRFLEKRRKRRGSEQKSQSQKIKDAEKEPWSERLASRGSLPLLFVAGIVMNLPGAAYLIALKDIAAAHHPAGTKVLLIVLFNVIMFLVAEVPLVGLTIAPDRTHERVSDLNVWVSGHGREIATTLCIGLGAFLVVRGFMHA